MSLAANASRRRFERALAFSAALLASFGVEVCCALSPDVCCRPRSVEARAEPADRSSCAECCCERRDDGTVLPEGDEPDGGPAVGAAEVSAPSSPVLACGCERDLGRWAAGDQATPPGERLLWRMPVRTRPRSVASIDRGARGRADSHRVPLRI